MDAHFWEEVERARRMTPREKASEGLRLRDEWVAQLLVGIRAEFPGISEEEAKQIRSERMDEMTRQRSAEKMRILEMIAADNARSQSERSLGND